MAKTTKTIAPREGTKQAKALIMLKGRKGATLSELSKHVKQKPVTVRTLISTLRSKGFKIEASDGRFRLQ